MCDQRCHSDGLGRTRTSKIQKFQSESGPNFGLTRTCQAILIFYSELVEIVDLVVIAKFVLDRSSKSQNLKSIVHRLRRNCAIFELVKKKFSMNKVGLFQVRPIGLAN